MKTFFLATTLFVYLIFANGYAQSNQPAIVTNTNDSGPGSLRQAILDLNNFNGPMLVFQLPNSFGGYINLQSPLPTINRPLIVTSGNASITIIAGNSTVAKSDGLAISDPAYYGARTVTALGNNSVNFTYQFFVPKAFAVTNTASSGAGSLMAALLAAEVRSVTPYDSIVFNIPGPAPHAIALSSQLDIRSRVVIDGTTQPANGYTGTAPKIELDGINKTFNGLSLYGGSSYNSYNQTYASQSEVYGLYIHGFSTAINFDYINGVIIGKPGKGNIISGNYAGISSANYGVNNNIIQNNIIGLDPTGTLAVPNQYGIRLLGNGTSILNNTISGNLYEGIGINTYYGTSDGAGNVAIKGNKIGTSINGTTAIPNGTGINMRNCSGLTVGGPGAERNIISGNTASGITLHSTSYGSSLWNMSFVNNYIGTDITGTMDLGNGTYGIYIGADSIIATIGGPSLSDGNIIAFNKTGIAIVPKGAKILNNSIFGNDTGIKKGLLQAPVITGRSATSVQGTAAANSIVQLFEDDGLSASPQGKTFIAEVNADGAGQWLYNGTVQKPCQLTAICIQPNYSRSSDFSLGSHPDLVPDTLIFCNGETASVKAADGFSSYEWNTGFSGQTFNTNASGKYWINVDNGCSYSDTVQIIFMDRPVIALGNDTSYCNTQTYVLHAGQVANASYAWSLNGVVQAGYTTPNLNVYQSGKYSVKTTIGQCEASDTIQINVFVTPNILTKATISKCLGQAYTITKPANFEYQWSDGSTSNTLTVTNPGIYTVMAVSPEGCSSLQSRDTLTVTEVDMPLNLGNDTSICGTTALVKNLSASGAYSYNWYRKPAGGNYGSVSSASSYSITQSGSYAVVLSKGNCTKKDTLEINFYPVPKAILGNDTLVCGAMTLSSRQNFSGALYTWSTGANSNSIPVTASGTYALEIKYTETCLSKDTITIGVVNCNAFQGIVYADKNNNSTYEVSDSLLKGKLIEAKSQTGVTYYSITQNDGSYRFDLPAGIYTVQAGITSAYITVPSLKYYTINAGQAPTQASYDFIINLPSKELSISMTSPASARLILDFVTTVTIRNEGKDSQRALVTISKDPFLEYKQSTAALISSSSNDLFFDAGYLIPGQTLTFYIVWTIPFNNTLSGKTLLLSANLNTDAVIENNHAINHILCRYPYDPNHKHVAIQYDPLTQQPRDSKRLQYVVEFQNTGTDTAYQVVIADTLSKKLNPLTFQPGAASAPYTWTIDAGGVVMFTFANIYLPDSNVNQLGSRGFVSFTIDHLLSQPGDSVYNEAAIVFDLAEPVITNKATYKVPAVQNGQDVFLNSFGSVKYGLPYIMINSGASSGLPVSYAYDGPIEVRGDTLFILGVGQVKLEVFQEGNNQFLSAVPKYQYFEIGKGDQLIYFESIDDKTVTDDAFSLNAYGGNSGNPIVFQVLRGPAIVDGNVVTLIGSGEVEIAATQAGNTLYEEASTVTRIFRVDVVTAVEGEYNSQVQAGPNPFTEYITVNDDKTEQTNRYELFDIQGMPVQAGTYYSGERITVMHLAKGSYILKVYKGEQIVLIQTLIKQ